MEYGCPEASYRIKGSVTDSEGNSIEGIAVMRYSWDSEGNPLPEPNYMDTTDADGRFEVYIKRYDAYMDNIDVDFHDIDGEQNGSYADTTVSVSFQGATFTGGDGEWYEGEATRTINVTLQHAE